jgi:oxygen-independent coproporphyrinogen-3 oxidase
MAGLYIHIPFCVKRCAYCDFFSSTDSIGKEKYIHALCNELKERKDYLRGQAIETIYFGGGTPTQLSPSDFEKIFNTIHAIYGENWNRETTLEANPDDINPDYLNSIRHFPFNRISLGIQSFDDRELQFLNRRHDARAAVQSVERLQQKGYTNISIDLMYGLPAQTLAGWEKNLRQTIALNVQHISAYHLIYEEGTLLYERLKKGNIASVEEDLSLQLFEILMDTLAKAGFEQYEISNFARAGFQSQHNLSYWNGTHYLGIGASAHSYNGVRRQWNKKTIGFDYKASESEMEIIDEKTAYNDFIITRLRMMKGMDLHELTVLFGVHRKNDCLRQARKYVENGLLERTDNHLRLTRKGLFISDGIMSDLIL